MSWVKDDRVEAFLNRLGTDYCYDTELNMDVLTEGWNVNNPSRPGRAIVPDAVEDYHARMQNGESPPAVIVIFQQDGSVFPLDGRQRLSAAMKAGWSHFNAYILSEETKRLHVQLIELGCNTCVNGSAPVDREYIFRRAAQVHAEHKISIPQLAQDLGIQEIGIRNHIKYTTELEFLNAKGIPADSMKKGAVLQLADLNREWWVKAPEPTKECVEILRRSNQTNGKVQEFVERANRKCKGKAKRSVQMQGYKRDLLADPVIANKLSGGKKRQTQAKVLQAVRNLRTVSLAAKREQIQLTASETEALIKELAEARQFLKFIVKQGAPV